MESVAPSCPHSRDHQERININFERQRLLLRDHATGD
jgi:hypothetical protein